MPFNSALVGTLWGPVEWQATPRRILAFRAVLQPDNAAGLDDAAGPLEALPMQVVTPEWVLALQARDHPDQTLSAEEGRSGVHAAQDSRFFAPIMAGDTLTVSGELIAVRASRAGAVATTRYRSVNKASGGLVAESISVSIFRGVDVVGGDRGEASDIRTPPFTPDGTARAIETPRGFPHQYSECADIWNPIHTERRVALAAGLPDILIHGTALWALGGLGVKPAGQRITRLAARFRSPAWAGAPMTLDAGVATADRRPFHLSSSAGEPLVEGFVETS